MTPARLITLLVVLNVALVAAGVLFIPAHDTGAGTGIRVGLVFDMIWPGSILPYYGIMFVIAAGLFTLRCRWLLAVGIAAAVAGAAIRWWRYERELDGFSTTWLTDPGPRSPRGLVIATTDRLPD